MLAKATANFAPALFYNQVLEYNRQADAAGQIHYQLGFIRHHAIIV